MSDVGLACRVACRAARVAPCARCCVASQMRCRRKIAGAVDLRSGSLASHMDAVMRITSAPCLANFGTGTGLAPSPSSAARLRYRRCGATVQKHYFEHIIRGRKFRSSMAPAGLCPRRAGLSLTWRVGTGGWQPALRPQARARPCLDGPFDFNEVPVIMRPSLRRRTLDDRQMSGALAASAVASSWVASTVTATLAGRSAAPRGRVLNLVYKFP